MFTNISYHIYANKEYICIYCHCEVLRAHLEMRRSTMVTFPVTVYLRTNH